MWLYLKCPSRFVVYVMGFSGGNFMFLLMVHNCNDGIVMMGIVIMGLGVME